MPKKDKPKLELEKILKEKDEYLAGWKRALADLDNFKKQLDKEKDLVVKLLKADIILKIIPVVSNFEKAISSVPAEQKNLDWVAKHPELAEWVKGILAIKMQLEDFLKKEGVERINCIGEKFDPTKHEAILEEETNEEGGMILEELEPGYRVGDKVIKYPKVKVSKKR